MLGQILFAVTAMAEVGGESPDLSESLDFATGIFAAFLLAVSLFAYRRTKLTRLLFVSAAFGLYAFRAILPRLDIYLPTVESTTITAILSVLGFVILALFFIAIVKKK
jgi:cbb3-type cytochrome oxidase subunit 3